MTNGCLISSEKWKEVKVFAVLRPDNPLPSNYRPINLLSNQSRIVLRNNCGCKRTILGFELSTSCKLSWILLKTLKRVWEIEKRPIQDNQFLFFLEEVKSFNALYDYLSRSKIKVYTSKSIVAVAQLGSIYVSVFLLLLYR